LILVTMSVLMLWMGIGSTFFTRRTAAASQTIIDQVEPQRPYEAGAPRRALPVAEALARVARVAKVAKDARDAKQIPGAGSGNR